ncbi:enoyl-CoA hydratase/isomerase family protein [Sphingopyxis sp. DHUNG17]|uniref:enoyl-CoA hydratase-related protein n=1 Tax=Sphingopyxis jiangsuensis TaxID=2871171 RepID=UPI00191E9DBB|nr:enoyl-CoA hydratase-related protein [Sphingopyxis lutea]MBL0770051.1 enoyl-CoA hydratase/isomerase family protein [Sphingopyxis lutea]
MTIEIENLRDVHLLRIANGPANILSVATGVTAALATALATAQAAPECRGVVIAGGRDIFCGGADLGDLSCSDDLRELFAAIEWSAIPVIMAIGGAALGGGVELALAGHWRIATRAARFALPEVGLGLLPGLGGTQRLPRLIGAHCALELMLSGREVTAEAALAAGLIDAIVDEDVVETAIRFVRDGKAPVRRTCELPPPRDAASAVTARRQTLRPSLNRAPERILDCVAGISADFSAGMRLEAKWFDRLVASEASGGLRHAFFAYRAAKHIPGLDKGRRARPPAAAHIWGHCAFSQQMALAMRASGVEVFQGDPHEGPGKPELVVVVNETDGLHAGPASTTAAVTAFPRRAATSSGKQDVHIRRDAQAAAKQVQFQCAGSGALLEVIRTQHTAPTALATMAALGKAMGKTVIVSGDRNGSIIERLIEGYGASVGSLLASGTSSDRIEQALTRWGMAQGPVAAGHLCSPAAGTCPRVSLRPQQASDAQIVELCLLHLINEGARLIDDQVAWRTADIDVVALEVLGFPRERGGPMFQADRIGLPRVLARLRSLYAEGRLAREPAALIETLARANVALSGYDATAGLTRIERQAAM